MQEQISIIYSTLSSNAFNIFIFENFEKKDEARDGGKQIILFDLILFHINL